MNISDVISQFAMLAGITNEQALAWQSICEAGMSAINARLKENINAEQNSRRLFFAAACAAYLKYAHASGCGKSIKLGDFSVADSVSSLKNAQALYEQALADCADLLVYDVPQFITAVQSGENADAE